jgi:hypothetical protein
LFIFKEDLLINFKCNKRVNLALKVVIADMTVSTGGVLRLNKCIMEDYNIKAGDRIVMMQDVNDSTITLQIQRGTEILARIEGAVPINLKESEKSKKDTE